MIIDAAIPLKNSESFNIDLLNDYLMAHAPSIEKIIGVTRFPGGYSNTTYCLQTAQKDLVLRMPPAGAQIQSAHDMAREFRVLSLLEPHYKKIPHPIHYCAAENILGAPFYIMERLQGVVLRAGNAPGLQLPLNTMHEISIALVDNLVALHAIDIEATDLIQLGKPDGYTSRQVAGWIKRYQTAETDTIENMNLIADWLTKNQPPTLSPTLLHNDYKYDNLILDPHNLSTILGVLDWEMATVGNPLMDLGATLAYWFEAGEDPVLKHYNLTWLAGNLTRKELADRYANKTGRDIKNIVFYYVFGLFKNAVILQQIYHRWKQGKSTDQRFGALLPIIHIIGDMAIKALEKDSI